MKREDLSELHYITMISNASSIRQLGILSHKMMAAITHESIAMAEIQDRRAQVIVPGGRPLHEYVNLYICARNPMMFKRRAFRDSLCVLRVSPDVLDLPQVVITSGNASSDYVRFAGAPDGIAIVDKELTFAEYWTHSDEIEHWKRKRAKCAEVLVPERVNVKFIMGAYVCSASLAAKFEKGLDIVANPNLFFG